jgi:hypothetical protein
MVTRNQPLMLSVVPETWPISWMHERRYNGAIRRFTDGSVTVKRLKGFLAASDRHWEAAVCLRARSRHFLF